MGAKISKMPLKNSSNVFTITMHNMVVHFYAEILKIGLLGIIPSIDPLISRCENVKTLSGNS